MKRFAELNETKLMRNNSQRAAKKWLSTFAFSAALHCCEVIYPKRIQVEESETGGT